MKIGIVTTWFERGAAYVSRQFKEVLEQEHEVYIYARGGERYAIGDPIWDTKEVWWGKRRSSLFHATYIDKKDFLHWIKEKKIELIIFNEQHWFMPLLWCKEVGVKTIAYIDYYTRATVPLFDIYDSLICNTKRHLSAFENHKHAFYIPWGTNTELYARTSIDLVNENVVTFFHSAGMSGYRKGTDILLKAYLKSMQKGKLVIHTQRDLKSQFPELAIDIDRLSSEGKLELITKTVTAPGLYYMGDIYVYPSRLEGIGLTIAESLSSGLGCIVPDNAPMNEFVTLECGVTVPIKKYFCREDGYYWPMCEADVDKLALILDDCSMDLDKVRKMKSNARLYAEQELSQKVNFKELLSVVEKTRFSKCGINLKKQVLEYSQNPYGKLGRCLEATYTLVNSLRKTS